MARTFIGLLVSLLAVTASAQPTGDATITADALQGLTLRAIGPALMGGRIADIAVSPRHRSTWYVAVGSGGLWKTENAGITWTPIFDDQSVYSIGCVSLDPNNPDIVWVGTGENVSGRHVGWGNGVYKSLDGGASWESVGLEASEHIGKILVDPRDGNVVYVAAEGPLWASGGERGLYKTSDGGATWTPSLVIDADTRCDRCRARSAPSGCALCGVVPKAASHLVAIGRGAGLGNPQSRPMAARAGA